MRKLLPIVLVALSGCVTTHPSPAIDGPATDGIARARIAQRVFVDGPQVTPLDVLEDSRCPQGVQCVWAGRLRLRVAVHLGSGDSIHEVTLGQPIHVADGNLTLVEALPARSQSKPTETKDYRFGFRFMGGY